MLKTKDDLYLQNRESREDHTRFAAERRTHLATAVFMALSAGLSVTAQAYESALTLNSDELVLAVDPYVLETEEVVTVQATDYSLSGTTLLRSKVFNTETGELRDLVVDEASGDISSIESARAAEEGRWRETHGALDLSLVKQLEPLQPTDAVEIVILPRQTATTESRKGKKTKSPLESTKSALRKAGIRGASIDPEAGHARVKASREEIQGIIAFMPEVAAVYPWEEPSALGLKVARDLVQAPLVAAHANGFGSDLTIAVYEPGACITRTHPDFQFVTFDARIGFDSNCQTGSAQGLHTTPVAGLLAASRPVDGSMESIGLFQGHMFDVESPASREMFARNPDFVNISATTTPVVAKNLDEAVYTQRIFIANGSANDGGDPNDIARCYSYNSLCVGGYHHKDTLGKGQFSDDTAAGSWRNDPESGREEPDVAGPFSVRSASYSGSGYTSEHGTSFSTPSVVGLAALLTANFETDLGRDPTLLRAVLMTSASHPISNPDDTTAPGVPDMDDGTDDRSGAGAPRGDRGKAILQNDRFLSENLDRDVDFTSAGKLNRDISFEAARGSTVRVVVAWDQCPVNLLSTRDALVADLDLVVDGPASDEFCNSTSSTGCGSGDGGTGDSGSAYDSGLTYDDSNSVLAPTTSYSTFSYSTSTSLTSSSLSTGDDVLAPVEETTVTDPDTTESTSTSLTQFALATSIVNKSYFSNPSAVDNYEILEFRAPATGTYHVNITAPRWDVCEYDGGKHTNVAVAWDVLSSSDL